MRTGHYLYTSHCCKHLGSLHNYCLQYGNYHRREGLRNLLQIQVPKCWNTQQPSCQTPLADIFLSVSPKTGSSLCFCFHNPMFPHYILPIILPNSVFNRVIIPVCLEHSSLNLPAEQLFSLARYKSLNSLIGSLKKPVIVFTSVEILDSHLVFGSDSADVHFQSLDRIS